MFVAAFSDTLYPFGELPVELGPPRLCQTSVCDVARERVLEDVLDLAFERRSRPAANQVAALEQMEVRLDVADELVDRPGPEHASDDRRSLQRSFLGLVEQVDARREHGLDGVWNLEAGRHIFERNGCVDLVDANQTWRQTGEFHEQFRPAQGHRRRNQRG